MEGILSCVWCVSRAKIMEVSDQEKGTNGTRRRGELSLSQRFLSAEPGEFRGDGEAE